MNQNREMLVSVIAVLQDDRAIVRPFVEELTHLLDSAWTDYELILVDDASTDGTVVEVQRLLKEYAGIRLIRLTRRFGFDVAVSAGLDSALGDCVVVMDPSSDPVEPIPQMATLAIAEGQVVVGRCRQRPAKTWMQRLGTRLLASVCRRWLTMNLDDCLSTYYFFPRQAVLSLTREKAKRRYLPSMARAIGFPNEVFDYTRTERRSPPRNSSLREKVGRTVGHLLTNNINPLRVATMLGLVASGLNFLYVGYIVGVNLFKERVLEGWTTLSLQVTGLFSFVFLILVLMSEYLGHILQESRDRPLYHVLDELNSTIPLGREKRNVVAEAGGDADDDQQLGGYLAPGTTASS